MSAGSLAVLSKPREFISQERNGTKTGATPRLRAALRAKKHGRVSEEGASRQGAGR